MSGDYFGKSVSLDGNTALVGAPGDDYGRGSAYLFFEDGKLSKLIATDRSMGDQFGSSVSLDGDIALIGARNDNNGQGSAYVFEIIEPPTISWVVV